MTDKSFPPLYYIRHGQTDWNAERRVQGRTDIALNETGHAQAKAVARALRAIEPDITKFKVYASPLTRVRETLGHILAAYGIDDTNVCFDERLAEVSFGNREGWTWPELNAQGIEPRVDPQKYFHWRPEGGESYADAAKRVESWLAEMREPSVVVAHGGISRILRGLILGQTGVEYLGLKVPQTKFFHIENRQIRWIDTQ